MVQPEVLRAAPVALRPGSYGLLDFVQVRNKTPGSTFDAAHVIFAVLRTCFLLFCRPQPVVRGSIPHCPGYRWAGAIVIPLARPAAAAARCAEPLQLCRRASLRSAGGRRGRPCRAPHGPCIDALQLFPNPLLDFDSPPSF